MYIYIYNILFNPVSHLDDTDVDIVYYVSENRGAWGFQNKQTNKQTNKKFTTRQSRAPLESSQTCVVGPFLKI